jgi:hypothetical protein
MRRKGDCTGIRNVMGAATNWNWHPDGGAATNWNRHPDGCTFCVVRESGQRWLRVVAGFICIAAVTACGTARAHVHKTAAPSLAWQFQTAGFLDAAGHPEPAVYEHTGGGGPIDWSMCVPGASKCKRLAVNDGMADPGPQPAGTVFKVSATVGSQTYSTTLRWRGALHVATPRRSAGWRTSARTYGSARHGGLVAGAALNMTTSGSRLAAPLVPRAA